MNQFIIELSIMLFSGFIFFIVYAFFRTLKFDPVDIFLYSFIFCISIFIFTFQYPFIVIMLNGILIFIDAGLKDLQHMQGENK